MKHAQASFSLAATGCGYWIGYTASGPIEVGFRQLVCTSKSARTGQWLAGFPEYSKN